MDEDEELLVVVELDGAEVVEESDEELEEMEAIESELMVVLVSVVVESSDALVTRVLLVL